MSESTGTHSGSRIGGLLVCVFMVLAGVVTLYDTLSYSDMDSRVFPRAAAIALIVLGIASIISSVLGAGADQGFGQGSWWRRVLLVLSMLAACLAMPHVGFLLAGLIAFFGSMLAAMHDRWNARLAILYLIASVTIMVGFYALFRFVLNVPLP